MTHWRTALLATTAIAVLTGSTLAVNTEPAAHATTSTPAYTITVPAGAHIDLPNPPLTRKARVKARQADFRDHTLRSTKTRDLDGIETSLYRGQYYDPALEPLRQCILHRESRGHYFSTNRTSGYFGGYQMGPALSAGATWMMTPEHKPLLGKKKAKKIMARLRGKPAHRWTRYWQDAAFYTILNWEGTRSGAKHWHLNGSRCT